MPCSIRRARRALAALLVGAPLLAFAQEDCPPPLAPPSAQSLSDARASARDRGFLWRLEKDGHASWLYGTVHVGRLAWTFPGPQVREALARADVLALELDLLDADTQRRLAAGSAVAGGELLTPVLRERLARRARIECASPALLATLKPEFQIAALAMLAARRFGLEPEYGIDMALAAQAHRDGKAVLALETVEAQLRAMSVASRGERVELVTSALDELDGGQAQRLLERTARTWASGDQAQLERYAQWCDCQRTPAEAAAMRRLLEARHPAMAARLDALHRGGRSVFAAVGSLHMIGARGLPALMAQRGYRVERVPLEAPMPDVAALWDFDDPTGSEARFRAALAEATQDAALSLRTQIARTLGLRSRFAEAQHELDAVDAELGDAGAEPRVRALLERGRVWRSQGDPARAQPLFLQAAQAAQAAGLEDLQVDALHMVALVQPEPEQQLAWTRRALAAARSAADPRARRWEASLTNNIGWSQHDAGRHDEALQSFRDALAARERDGASPVRLREARWAVARELRALARHDEALGILRRLDAELRDTGASDGFVPEEIAENLLALGRAGEARPYFARAATELARLDSLERPDDARLARLQALSH